LSEAEWEYAARARTAPGTYPRYWFGNNDKDLCRYGNGADQTAKSAIAGISWTGVPCADGYAYTSPVGSFAANDFGLYDMLGEAWQWTEDCYHDSYVNAPSMDRHRPAETAPVACFAAARGSSSRLSFAPPAVAGSQLNFGLSTTASGWGGRLLPDVVPDESDGASGEIAWTQLHRAILHFDIAGFHGGIASARGVPDVASLIRPSVTGRD